MKQCEEKATTGGEGSTLPSPDSPPEIARTVFGERLNLAVAYHHSLATTGSERGFLGPREVPRLWERHILNSAVLGEAIDKGATVIDVGSGAGLPGIPLAIARPDLRVILVEPLLKRSTYLHEVREELGLENVAVLRGRAEEDAVKKALPRVDVVTARAVAPLGKLSGWCLPLVALGGVMLAMKGASAAEEVERDAGAIRRAGGADVAVLSVGEGVVDEPATLVRVTRRR